jgi:hypothetical protein
MGLYDLSTILKDYVNGASTFELSKKYSIGVPKLKELLRSHLGNEQYLRIAHSNGGKVVVKKLRNPIYRLNYARKMSLRVKRSLNQLMRSKRFRDEWSKKACKGSKRGILKLHELLSNPEFNRRWTAKCKVGGFKTYETKKGFYAAPRKSRRSWSLLGLQRTGRKLVGPRGESMYNDLEVSVASILHELGVEYIYEKIIPVGNMNGFISVDFTIPRIPNLFIEVTCWNKPSQKLIELKKKWKIIRHKCPEAEMIVVTSPKYVDVYKKLPERDINVFTPKELKDAWHPS